MCGIWAVFGGSDKTCEYCKAATTISHRGKDAFRFESIQGFPKAFMAHHRLAIVGSIIGVQPTRILEYPHLTVVHNGEIYNFEQLQKEHDFHGTEYSDAESIIRLYAVGGIEYTVKRLDGSFAFCLFDSNKRKVYIGRDLYGIRPAFRIHTTEGLLAVSSEAKGLMTIAQVHGGKIEEVAPGHVETYHINKEGNAVFERRIMFYDIVTTPIYKTMAEINNKQTVEENIKILVKQAVLKRMTFNSKRRFGCILSGDVGSAVVASVLVREAQRHNVPYKVQTFSVGIENCSSNLEISRQVAEYLGTEHHEVLFTADDAARCLSDMIYHLESYDVNTVRASYGLFLLSKYIQEKTNTVIVLSGEGAEEILHSHSSDGKWTNQRSKLHNKLLILDRTTAAAGLEYRVPFLDHQLSSYIWHHHQNRRSSHDLLSSVFRNVLPQNIAWNDNKTGEGYSELVEQLHNPIFKKIKKAMQGRNGTCCIESLQIEERTYYKQIFDGYYRGQGDWVIDGWNQLNEPVRKPKDHITMINEIESKTEYFGATYFSMRNYN